ncbi:MAG: hypothetical protein L3J97_02310 [Thermoplasmata archaeon]|nr:hypothetical protein [Thermoplasmata archaeon]
MAQRTPEQVRNQTFGVVALVLAVILMVAGGALAAYCTSSFVGICFSNPYAAWGIALFGIGAILLLVGIVLVILGRPTPSPPPSIPPPPPGWAPYPQPPPASYSLFSYAPPGQVVVVQPQPARVLLNCRNCGSLYDAPKGRCDRCGAPPT